MLTDSRLFYLIIVTMSLSRYDVCSLHFEAIGFNICFEVKVVASRFVGHIDVKLKRER